MAWGKGSLGLGDILRAGISLFSSARLPRRFCGDSRRRSFSVIQGPNECYRDLRRRRIHAKTAQTNIKVLARQIPYLRLGQVRVNICRQPTVCICTDQDMNICIKYCITSLSLYIYIYIYMDDISLSLSIYLYIYIYISIYVHIYIYIYI